MVLAASTVVIVLALWIGLNLVVPVVLVGLARYERRMSDSRLTAELSALEPASAERRGGMDRRSAGDRRCGRRERRIELPEIRHAAVDRRRGPAERRSGFDRRRGLERRRASIVAT